MSATSDIRGHSIYYDEENGVWKYSDTHETVGEKLDWELVPEPWKDRCSGDGYERYDDWGVRRYKDNNQPIQDGYRPCARCGHYPTPRGDDYCIRNLGKVINACCGHGNKKGYIQFDDGTIIEGYFTVIRREPNA